MITTMAILKKMRPVLVSINGPRFLKAAAEMNEKYGLNIEVHPTSKGLKVSDAATKHSLARFFWVPVC